MQAGDGVWWPDCQPNGLQSPSSHPPIYTWLCYHRQSTTPNYHAHPCKSQTRVQPTWTYISRISTRDCKVCYILSWAWVSATTQLSLVTFAGKTQATRQVYGPQTQEILTKGLRSSRSKCSTTCNPACACGLCCAMCYTAHHVDSCASCVQTEAVLLHTGERQCNVWKVPFVHTTPTFTLPPMDIQAL